MTLYNSLEKNSRKLRRARAGRKSEPFTFGQFSEIALDFLSNCDADINAQTGAIRSGKTINSTIAWLEFLGKSKYDQFLQSGRTLTSLYRNVLLDEFKILTALDIEYEYRKGDRELWIEDKLIYLMGFSNQSIAETIRGMTIGGWNADETNTYPETTVREALDRCSEDDARVFWTMNPDSPYHWIYTDFLTNKIMLDAGDIKVWHYTLYDNPNLSQKFIERTERRYPEGTIWHKRKILGQWVIAEGVIYDRFTEGLNTFGPYEIPFGTYDDDDNLQSLDYDNYVIGTDYGSGNVTVFGLFGLKHDEKKNITHYHLLNEFYWDAVQKRKQLTENELITQALKLRNFHGRQLYVSTFFTPHDAASLRAELDENFPQISHQMYKPDVLNDIHMLQTLITDGRFKISKTCKNSISQAQTYAWDPKSRLIGIDKPLKVNDHCPDMWRAPILGSGGKFKPFIQSLPMW
jgi:PBSX family phage terminase large subunit